MHDDVMMHEKINAHPSDVAYRATIDRARARPILSAHCIDMAEALNIQQSHFHLCLFPSIDNNIQSFIYTPPIMVVSIQLSSSLRKSSTCPSPTRLLLPLRSYSSSSSSSLSSPSSLHGQLRLQSRLLGMLTALPRPLPLASVNL